jgi:hypothetical protein
MAEIQSARQAVSASKAKEQLQSMRHRRRWAGEHSHHKVAIELRIKVRNERGPPFPKPEHDNVHSGDRSEIRTTELVERGCFEPWVHQQCRKCGSRCADKPLGSVALHDQVRIVRWIWRTSKPTDNVGGYVERDVGKDFVRLMWQAHFACITLTYVHGSSLGKPDPETFRKSGIQLDGYDFALTTGESS